MPTRLRVKYLERWPDRHGKMRLYFRRGKGPRTPLRGPVGSDEFWEDYNAARSGDPKAIVGPMRSLIVKYYESGEFKRMKSKRVRRGILDRFCKGAGDRKIEEITPAVLRKVRDDMADRPEAANNLLKALRQVFRFAIATDRAKTNPALEVPLFKSKSDGFHSWTLAEVEQYEETHPIGTKARLALALLLYTGQRRGDVVKLGRQHARNGWLSFRQEKTGKEMDIPILSTLQEIIDASPTGDLTYLVTAFNKPFTSNGFGNRMRKWCDEANLPRCSAHGLRKAAGYRMAEIGCTEHEIMSILGHDTLKEVERYTKAARRKVMAKRAGERIEASLSQTSGDISPNLGKNVDKSNG